MFLGKYQRKMALSQVFYSEAFVQFPEQLKSLSFIFDKMLNTPQTYTRPHLLDLGYMFTLSSGCYENVLLFIDLALVRGSHRRCSVIKKDVLKIFANFTILKNICKRLFLPCLKCGFNSRVAYVSEMTLLRNYQ